MPNSSIKNEKMYEDLRKQGDSKEKAARISNAAAAQGVVPRQLEFRRNPNTNNCLQKSGVQVGSKGSSGSKFPRSRSFGE